MISIREYGVTVCSDGKDVMILTEYEPDRARMEGKIRHALRLMLIKLEGDHDA